MAWLAILTSSIALLFDIVTLSINFGLLWSIFITKSIKKSEELTLFYARFAIDVLLCFSNSFYQIFILLHFLKIEISNPILTFLVNFPSVSMQPIRAIMVLVITTDRTLAVFLPIKHHIHRRKIPNSLIILGVFGYLLIDSGVLWGVCDYQLIIPKDCVGFRCINSDCYISYWVAFEQTMYISIGSMSFLLVIKLFIWNKCTRVQKTGNFTRANRLALIDTLMIALFDLLPIVIIAKNLNYDFEKVGPVNAMIRVTGYSIEGCLVIRALIRRNGGGQVKHSSGVVTT